MPAEKLVQNKKKQNDPFFKKFQRPGTPSKRLWLIINKMTFGVSTIIKTHQKSNHFDVFALVFNSNFN